MYDFLFWFTLKFYEHRDKDDSSFIPALTVTVAFLIHIGMIYTIVRYYTGYNFDWANGPWGIREKFLIMSGMFLLGIIVWLIFYRKRKEAILKCYENSYAFRFINYVFVFLMLVAPVLVGAIFAEMYHEQRARIGMALMCE